MAREKKKKERQAGERKWHAWGFRGTENYEQRIYSRLVTNYSVSFSLLAHLRDITWISASEPMLEKVSQQRGCSHIFLTRRR
jgi:hypothetical protein